MKTISTNEGENYVEHLLSRIDNANTAATSLQIQNIKLIRESATLTAHNAAMQADAVNNTATINLLNARIANITAAIEDVKYYVNNPSAWEHYDDGVSEKIRTILKVAGVA